MSRDEILARSSRRFLPFYLASLLPPAESCVEETRALPMVDTTYGHFTVEGETKVLTYSQEVQWVFKRMQDAEGNWCWTYPVDLPEQDWRMN